MGLTRSVTPICKFKKKLLIKINSDNNKYYSLHQSETKYCSDYFVMKKHIGFCDCRFLNEKF